MSSQEAVVIPVGLVPAASTALAQVFLTLFTGRGKHPSTPLRKGLESPIFSKGTTPSPSYSCTYALCAETERGIRCQCLLPPSLSPCVCSHLQVKYTITQNRLQLRAAFLKIYPIYIYLLLFSPPQMGNQGLLGGE